MCGGGGGGGGRACHSLITGLSFELDILDLRRFGGEGVGMACVVVGDGMVVEGTAVVVVGVVTGVRQARPSFSKAASSAACV